MGNQAFNLNGSTEAIFVGVGIHSGRPGAVRVRPRTKGHGIVFHSLNGNRSWSCRASPDAVTCPGLCTGLTVDGRQVLATIEHLMAALAGAGIWNAEIGVIGPEIPILDGSAAPFLTGLQSRSVAQAVEAYRPARTILVEDGDSKLILEPSEAPLSMDIQIEFPGLGHQRAIFEGGEAPIMAEVSDARTFVLEAQIPKIRKAGLAKAGNLGNALVLADDGSAMNPGGLRHADEPVRHKALDLIGDLALIGSPIMGHLTAIRPGHAINNRLARAVYREMRDAAFSFHAPIGDGPRAASI